MKIVLQRVKIARVKVKQEIVGEINSGILLFLGVGKDDREKDLEMLSNKIVNLRIFPDEKGKMNFSILDLKKEIMIISQFTLYADCRKGNRPSFTEAAPAELAELLYNKFVEKMKEYNLKVATGKFGEIMEIEAIQDGPVTIVLDTKEGLKNGN